MPSMAASTPALGSQAQVAAGPAKSYYRPQLDGLRFFAFLAVFFQHTFHADPDYYLQWSALKPLHLSWVSAKVVSSLTLTGGIGVDLFFALSSFLITGLLIREIQSTGTVHLKYFYTRRVLRIWPVYGLVLLLGIVLLPLLRLSSAIQPVYVGAYIFLLGNWSCALLGTPLPTIGALWSISIEEQFYLFWPFVVRKAGLARLKWFCVGLLVAGVLSRLVFLLAHASDNFVYFNTFAHIEPIAWGALLALAMRGSHPAMTPFRKVSLALVCTVGMVTPLVLNGIGAKALSSLVAMPFFELCCAGAIFLALQVDFLGVEPLRYLGKISYGLYAYHGAVLFLLDRIVPHGSRFKLIMIPVKFLVTILAASLSYAFLETPILRLKERFAFVKSRPV